MRGKEGEEYEVHGLMVRLAQLYRPGWIVGDCNGRCYRRGLGVGIDKDVSTAMRQDDYAGSEAAQTKYENVCSILC